MSLVFEGRCEICGTRGPVENGLVAWVTPIQPPFEAIDRCTDRAACRARVVAAGDEWPVREKGEPR